MDLSIMSQRSVYTSLLAAVVLAVAACGGTRGHVQATSESTQYPQALDVTERNDWGSVEVSFVVPEHTISKITIHHGGEAYDEERDTSDYLRSLQSWSRSDKGWMDIPYHYVIDLEGRIFEARPIQYPGDTNTSYDPSGHALIVLVGNYEEREMTESQMESLTSLTAFLAQTYRVGGEDIKGHKDYAETACPGENIHRYLRDGTLVEAVNSKLQAGL